uniref:Zinc finger CCCH domain-containing protein 14 n=1 Tax=Rhipicephalus appendiculatus TaxID=34631 RepID=A0A131YUT0_RHIAP
MDGNEVTQKIRAAIKTKLMELGAYVDDELPDYIMVMIANKKTKEQMTQDLSLFLGESTLNFTTWLQGVLDHLQAIATEAKQRGKEQLLPLVSSSPGEPVRPVLPPHLDIARQQEVVETPSVAPAIAVAPSLMEEPSLPEYSDEVLALKADPEPDDDLADDLRAMVEQPLTTQQPRMASSGASSSVSLVRPIPRASAPEQASKERATKKSVVAAAAVVRRKPHFLSEAEDDDEEYDPSNPSVGSIASVVKVSERRSSVPEGMQANKLLLLKAMKAAHQSVSSSTRRNPSARVEPYQPTPLRELGSKRRRPASRLGSARTGDFDDENSMPPAKRPSGLSIKERLGRRRASSEEPVVPSALERAPTRMRASRIVGAIAPEVRPDFSRATEKNTVAAPAADAAVTRDVVSLEQDDADLLELDVANEDVHSVVKDTTPTSTPNRLSGVDDSATGHPGSLGSSPSSSQWPRFVVTLDGVDPTSFKSSNSHREVLTTGHDLEELPEEEDEEQLVPAASRRPPVKSRLMMAPVSSAELMEDASMVEEEEAMAVDDGASHILEKCRYWPACKNGDQCPYHHPSVPCKAFPNCKYRDKCLFIHPNCKYDAFCKRKDCLFTHASRRSFACPPPVVSSPSVQQCKFYPHCTNLKCPFFHPKPCKFGAACQSSSCPYSHPEGGVPPPNKLKWTSATAKKAGETAA